MLMGELSLRLKIADREYPMKVRDEEEDRVRRAARQVNEKLKSFRSHFGVDDKQDLLAMVAFDSMIKLVRMEESSGPTENENDHILKKIATLNNLIEQEL